MSGAMDSEYEKDGTEQTSKFIKLMYGQNAKINQKIGSQSRASDLKMANGDVAGGS